MIAEPMRRFGHLAFFPASGGLQAFALPVAGLNAFNVASMLAS
jgi:hypothetical protein